MKLSMPKLQERDQALILIAIGLLVAVLVYVFVYQKFTEETQSIESTNSTMRQQIDLLQNLTNNRAQYETDTEQYIADAQEILDTFPVDLMEEDMMLYALHLDQLEDETFIASISTPRRAPVGLAVPAREDNLQSAQDITGQIAANAYVNDGSVLDVSEAVLNTANSNIAVTTSYNGFKNLIIDIIGWVLNEEDAEIPGEMPNPSGDESETIINDETPPGAEAPVEGEGAPGEGESVIDGTETGLTGEETNPVEGTDEPESSIIAQRRINSISLSFAEDTGEYMATVDFSFFSMEGMGREYIKPDPGVEDHGINNLFGSEFSNGTLLPPLDELDSNYIPPQPGEVIFPVGGEENQTMEVEGDDDANEANVTDGSVAVSGDSQSASP